MIGGYRAFPFLPATPEGILTWAHSFVATLDSELFWIDDRISSRITYGTTANRPASTGSGNLYYDTDLGKLQVDLGTGWADVMSGAAIDHGGLTGLGDDDHTQYLLAAGTRALTADWDAGSFEIRAQTLESDVAAGTAPFTVASNTVVTNLNADLLDGNEAAAFAASGHNHDAAYISIIAAPAANHFPYQTAGGELIDSAYDAADFAAAGHNHDAAYISIIAAPADNHFPYQTAAGELDDSGYDAADFAAAGHNHDADYVDIDGDTMTGDLILNNSIAVAGKETGATARDLIQMNASNEVEFGNDTTDTRVKGGTIYMGDAVRLAKAGMLVFDEGFLYAYDGHLYQGLMGFSTTRFTMNSAGWECYAPQDITFVNAKGVKGYNAAAATAYGIAKINASDEVELGSASLPLNLMGTRVDAVPGLLNAVPLRGLETGGTARDMVVMNVSDQVVVGNATNETRLYGNPVVSTSVHRFGNYVGGNYGELQTDGDLIQYGTSYIQNVARVESLEFRGKLWETGLSKTLTNNTALNLWKWGGTSNGDALGFHGTLTFELKYSNAGSTYYWSRSYTYVGEILRVGTGTNLMKGVFTATANGAAQHYKSDGTAGVGTIAETLTMATASTTSLGPTGKIYLSGTGTWVSGRMKYTLQSTDVDHTGFTLFT